MIDLPAPTNTAFVPSTANTTRPVDTGAVVEWLRSAVEWPTGCELVGARINRLWSGRKGRLSFELSTQLLHDGQQGDYLLQGGIGPGSKPGRQRARAKLTDQGLLGLHLHCPDPGMWVCTPDCDPHLRVASKFFNSKRLAPLLDELDDGEGRLSGMLDDNGIDLELLAYRAHKRCVVRIRSSAKATAYEGIFIKAFRRAPDPEKRHLLVTLPQEVSGRSDGLVRIPRVVTYSPDWRLIVTAEVPRVTVSVESTNHDTALAAQAVAVLHSVKPPLGLVTHLPVDEVQTVSRWVDGLASVGKSSYGQRLLLLIENLSSRFIGASLSPSTLIHRDFYKSQLIHHQGSIWMTDLDTLCIGHAELDAATYIAHEMLEGLKQGQSKESLARISAEFITHYERFGGQLDPDRLYFYLSCALARLGAIHLVRGLSGDMVETLWCLAGFL